MNKTTIVKFAEVRPDPENPRQAFNPVEMKHLEDSIKIKGIRQSLVVEREAGGTYLLLDGERRYRAAKHLGLKELPVVIEEPMSPEERMTLRFHLQEQHAQWNTWEKALAVASFQKVTKMDAAEIADALGIGKGTITKYLFVTAMSKRHAEKIMERKLPMAYMVAMGRMAKDLPEEYRTKVMDAAINKIDKHIIVRSRDLEKVTNAMVAGGEKVIRKFIDDENYGPQRASIDAGTNIVMYRKIVTAGCSSIKTAGEQLLKQKNLVFSKTGHNALVNAYKILKELVDADYEDGKSGT